MKPLVLLLCLFVSINAVFAQSSSVKSSTQSSGEMEDTTKVALSSNSSGQQVFVVNKGKGQTEVQSVDQFLASKASVQLKSNFSPTVSVKSNTVKTSSAPANVRELAIASQKSGKDSSALLMPNKLPPVLSEGPPKN